MLTSHSVTGELMKNLIVFLLLSNLSAGYAIAARAANMTCQGETSDRKPVQMALWASNKTCSNPKDKEYCNYNEVFNVALQIIVDGKIIEDRKNLRGEIHYLGTPANSKVSRSIFSVATIDLSHSNGWQLDAAVMDPLHSHFHLSSFTFTTEAQEVAYVDCQNDLE